LSWRCGGRAGGDENMERRRETRGRRIRGGGLENTDHGETSAEAKREREKGNIHRREDEERNGGERSGGGGGGGGRGGERVRDGRDQPSQLQRERTASLANHSRFSSRVTILFRNRP